MAHVAVSTINATAGSATANCYTTVAFADQFHADRPPVGTSAATGLWHDASTDQKTAALLWATKVLEQYFEWNGSVVNTTQSLLWPRAGLYAMNGLTELDTTTVPVQIQWATAEFARQLLVGDRTGDSIIESQGLKMLKAGPIRMDFKDTVYPKPIPDAVVNLIPWQWGYPKNGGERELVRA